MQFDHSINVTFCFFDYFYFYCCFFLLALSLSSYFHFIPSSIPSKGTLLLPEGPNGWRRQIGNKKKLNADVKKNRGTKRKTSTHSVLLAYYLVGHVWTTSSCFLFPCVYVCVNSQTFYLKPLLAIYPYIYLSVQIIYPHIHALLYKPNKTNTHNSPLLSLSSRYLSNQIIQVPLDSSRFSCAWTVCICAVPQLN